MKKLCFAAVLSLATSVGYGFHMKCVSQCGAVQVDVRVNDCEQTISLKGTAALQEEYPIVDPNLVSEDGIGVVQFRDSAVEYGQLVTLAADETTVCR